MGRRKIEIKEIKEGRNRSVTFLKRKQGLMKKAYELAVLCNAEIAVVIFSQSGKLHEFSSAGDIDHTLMRYSDVQGRAYESKGPSDFSGLKGDEDEGPAPSGSNKKRRRGDDDEDDFEEEYSGSDNQHSTSPPRDNSISSHQKLGVATDPASNNHHASSAGEQHQPALGSLPAAPFGQQQQEHASVGRQSSAHEVEHGHAAAGQPDHSNLFNVPGLNSFPSLAHLTSAAASLGVPDLSNLRMPSPLPWGPLGFPPGVGTSGGQPHPGQSHWPQTLPPFDPSHAISHLTGQQAQQHQQHAAQGSQAPHSAAAHESQDDHHASFPGQSRSTPQQNAFGPYVPPDYGQYLSLLGYNPSAMAGGQHPPPPNAGGPPPNHVNGAHSNNQNQGSRQNGHLPNNINSHSKTEPLNVLASAFRWPADNSSQATPSSAGERHPYDPPELPDSAGD